MMSRQVLIVMFVCAGLISRVAGQGTECSGSNWMAFSDEKCVKIINILVTHEEAENLCNEETQNSSQSSTLPPLLTIKSADEQTFLTKFLFDDSQIVDNVWLGGSRVDETHFQWSDGANFDFTNWRVDHPTNHSENGCVQITPSILKKGGGGGGVITGSKGEGDGFWTDVSCQRRNLVVCQKLPIWSLLHLQKSFIDLRRNPVPIGFIYVQLPDQPDANTAWPNLGWIDVTGTYAGLFFRAEGAGSEAFGTPQTDQTRRITAFTYAQRTDAEGGVYGNPMAVPPVGSSDFGSAGTIYGSDATNIIIHEGLAFNTDDVEVRPKNTAVRIWKRIY